MNPRAILFDLDDTILTCEGGDHLKLWKSSVDRHLHLFPGVDANEFYKEIRAVADEFWSDPDRHKKGRLNIRAARHNIVKQAAKKLQHPNDEAATQLANDYHDRREFNVVPFKGALETLQHFKHQTVKTALITNGSTEVQRTKIEKFDLDRFFDLVLVEGEFGRGKPDPAVYEHVTNCFGLQPAECCIVGDNLEWEVRVPKSLGFYTIWNDFRREGLPYDTDVCPDQIVCSIAELVDLFASL